jgi:hypothetical protein
MYVRAPTPTDSQGGINTAVAVAVAVGGHHVHLHGAMLQSTALALRKNSFALVWS